MGSGLLKSAAAPNPYSFKDSVIAGAPNPLALGGSSMGKSTPQAPQSPDPMTVANAQSQVNKDTALTNAALNRINQNTPWGSLTYTQNGVDANGIPQYTQNITLSPEQQKLMQSDSALSQAMANLGLQQAGSLGGTLGKPIVTNADKTHVQTPWDAYGGNLTRNANSDIGLVTRADYGKIQDDLDLSKVPGLIGGDKLAEDLATQRDALYRQQSAFLDPQWKQDQSDLENKLIQQGIAQNSDAWNRAVGDFSRNKEFAYSNARNQAITGGGAEQSRLFGLGLASNQNAFNQALGTGQFHNQAQQQGFGQELSNAQLNNAAQAQQFQQSLANAQLGNSTQQQMYDQLMRSQQTQFDQSLANANLNNQGRTQAINELNALRSGSQVNVPQFSGVPQAVAGGTDVSSLYNNQYQGQLAQYNAGIANNNSNTQGLVGLAAAAAAAY